MSTDPEILAAEARAQAARARLFGTLGEIQDRLKPSNIAQDALDSASQSVATAARKGAEMVRARPYAAAAVAGAFGLVLTRGWIAKLFRRRESDETAPTADGLNNNETTPALGAKKG